MVKDLKNKVLETVQSQNVKFVLMQFMDILGTVKNITIPSAKLEGAIDNGVFFDGSSILGYATIEESDMRALPDLKTFQVLPWTDGEMKSARLICNIQDSKGNRFSGDPRYVLEHMMKKARDKGYIFNTGPEFEFFLFKFDEKGKPTTIPSDAGRYFDLMPLDPGEMVRKETSLYLDSMNFNVEATHHEVAPGQHEIDLRYTDALTMADHILTLKDAIKTVALKHNLHATFMPKPIFGECGSGMHTHQSLISPDGKSNVFYDKNRKYMLSDICLWYIGGLLKYARETCAILASWVNSYKRLVPGYEAPVYISWANMNRSAFVRVPAGRGMSTRAELRNPDPAGNPYLQFAVMLAAGLKGIENKIMPPDPVEVDIYRLTSSKRKELGIDSLPANLGEALSELRKSELMKETLGAHIFTHYLYIKEKEWDEYRTQVTGWEIEKFLSTL